MLRVSLLICSVYCVAGIRQRIARLAACRNVTQSDSTSGKPLFALYENSYLKYIAFSFESVCPKLFALLCLGLLFSVCLMNL